MPAIIAKHFNGDYAVALVALTPPGTPAAQFVTVLVPNIAAPASAQVALAPTMNSGSLLQIAPGFRLDASICRHVFGIFRHKALCDDGARGAFLNSAYLSMRFRRRTGWPELCHIRRLGARQEAAETRRSEMKLTERIWTAPDMVPVEMPIDLKHIDSAWCWCEPVIEVDDDGDEVVVHRTVTWN